MKNYSKAAVQTAVTCASLFLFAACSSTETGTVLANAGGDQDVLAGTTASLDGLSSVGTTKVAWTLSSKPASSAATLSNSDQLEASFSADVVGDYVATLSINDGASTDTVTITAKSIVADIAPSGSVIKSRERLGTDEYYVNLEETGATLSAEASQVSAGSSVATYSWEQIGGPTATITSVDSTSSTLEFTAPDFAAFQNSPDTFKWQLLPVSRDDRKMLFRVTMTDSEGNSDAAVLDVYLTDNDAEIHTSSGLPSIGVGTRAYLSGPTRSPYTAGANAGVISDWSWSLELPEGSSAVFADTGTTTSSLQFPYFIPDVSGLYTVSYASTALSAVGVTTSGSISINVSTYTGIGNVGGATPVAPECANCHDGSVQSDKVTGYLTTAHASIFEDNVAPYSALAPAPYLWEFHSTGYHTDADSNGFDDLASDANFTFPASGMTFAEFLRAEPTAAKLANVQCESCHGPGADHQGSPLRTSFSASQFGVCGQCHTQEGSWVNGRHNVADASHQSSWLGANCARCHSAPGFAQYVGLLADGETELVAGEEVEAQTETGAHMGVACAGCHDPHDATNPAQLRRYGEVIQIIDGGTVDAGKSAVCYTCHDGYYNYGHVECDSDDSGTAESECLTVDQMATEYTRQVHYNSQSAVFEGKGALTDLDGDSTDDFVTDENSFHTDDGFIMADVTGDPSLSTTNDKCVTCHMAEGPAVTEEGYNKIGGHSFEARSIDGNDYMLTSVCQKCHLDVDENLDRPARGDYDGDGEIEGIESEVKGLLYLLSEAIKTGADAADISQTSGTTIAVDGSFTVSTLSYTTTGTGAGQADNPGVKVNGWYFTTDETRREVYNYNLIAKGDKSWGIHNAAYIIQVLQGTLDFMGVDTSDMTIR